MVWLKHPERGTFKKFFAKAESSNRQEEPLTRQNLNVD
jgi:hypothetical protein